MTASLDAEDHLDPGIDRPLAEGLEVGCRLETKPVDPVVGLPAEGQQVGNAAVAVGAPLGDRLPRAILRKPRGVTRTSAAGTPREVSSMCVLN